MLQKRLEAVGCAAVMPLASPIGSGRGLKLRHAIEIMIEQAEVPVVVDAGLGAPSQAAEAMELGADAVLVNTAIARAEDPAEMGRAFRLAVEAGRTARLAGLIEELETAEASSPDVGRPRLAASRDAEGVTVTVNGRPQEAGAGETVESLLDRLGLAARYALVERNGEPVERDRYGETELEEGDSLVVARPVAGG